MPTPQHCERNIAQMGDDENTISSLYTCSTVKEATNISSDQLCPDTSNRDLYL